MKQYRRLIFILVIVLVGLRPLIARLTDRSVFRGPWYTVAVPQGWERKIEEDTVSFIAPDENIMTGMPEAVFSIYTKKSSGALFLETLMEEVMTALSQMNGRLLDQGEIMIDGQVSKWVLFLNEEPQIMMLSFYIVDDFNRLTRIQFVTTPRDFKKHRQEFERFKESLRFKKLF